MTRTQTRINIFSVDTDDVVDAKVATGRTSYEYALEHLVPLIARLDIQRRIQNPRFYDRLKSDIQQGCLMPPITIAFVRERQPRITTEKLFENFVNNNISEGFVLDGIQRLFTLQRAYDESIEGEFPSTQSIFVNILVCSSMDNLLYRMITLNNGQRPMTTRHQIELLTTNLFDFSVDGLKLATEKQGIRRAPGIFPQSDFVLGYMAFLSDSTNIDSQKLIQEKLDDLLASKILEHEPTKDQIQFTDVMELVTKLIESKKLEKWFRVNNNLVGFCAGIRGSYKYISRQNIKIFEGFIDQFEEAFRSFDVSKIKLGRSRRNAVSYVIKHAEKTMEATAAVITDKLINVLE